MSDVPPEEIAEDEGAAVEVDGMGQGDSPEPESEGGNAD